MALSKDQILKHTGVRKYEEVHIPEWADENGDDVVRVRGLTIREFEIHQSRIAREAAALGDNKDPRGDAAARFLVRCIVDEDGKLVFSDDDAGIVSNLSLGAVLKLQSAIDKASGVTEESGTDARGESETTSGSNSSSE